MKLYLGLMWIKSNRSLKSSFKLPGAFESFDNYVDRMGIYCDVNVQNPNLEALKQRGAGEVLWLCERLKGRSKILSSEQLSEALRRATLEGVKKLWVVIGPPDGLAQELIEKLRPELSWSFGPATYPHELASVMASEQLYRAWTILKNHPYHCGH